MSGIALTAASGQRTSTVKPDEELKAALPAPPVAWREFPKGDELALFAEVYDNDVKTPHTVDITTTVVAEDGKTVFTAHEERQSSDLQGKPGGYGHTARFSTADFAPGTYVLTVEAKSRAGKTGQRPRAAFSSGSADERADAGARGQPAGGVGHRVLGVVGDRRAGMAHRSRPPDRPVPRDAVDDRLRRDLRRVGDVLGGELPRPGGIVRPVLPASGARADRPGRRRHHLGRLHRPGARGGSTSTCRGSATSPRGWPTVQQQSRTEVLLHDGPRYISPFQSSGSGPTDRKISRCHLPPPHGSMTSVAMTSTSISAKVRPSGSPSRWYAALVPAEARIQHQRQEQVVPVVDDDELPAGALQGGVVDEVLLRAVRADVALERELARDDLFDGDLLVPAVAAVLLLAAGLRDLLGAAEGAPGLGDGLA